MAPSKYTKKKIPKEPNQRGEGTRGGEGRPKERRQRTASRMQEVYGILLLAGVMLLGPSLVSVQLGDGTLMGPFGLAVGSALNWLLGLAAHLAVASLLIVALHIFAGSLGSREAQGSGQAEAPPAAAVWRERAGLALGVFCLSVLLHLIFRPVRFAGASAGGIVGELSAELLCAAVSAPGTWVLALSGLALAAVLSTSISWTRVGITLGRAALASGRGVLRSVLGTWVAAVTAYTQLREGLRALGQGLAQLAQRRPQPSELGADGSAALPPVLRLDLSLGAAERNAQVQSRPGGVAPLPQDLEIGPPAHELPPPPRPKVHAPLRLNAEARDDAPADGRPQGDPAPGASTQATPAQAPAAPADARPPRDSAAPPAPPAAADGPAAPTVDELTIVESRFVTAPQNLGAVEPEPDKQVEQTAGPGFLLHHETYRPPPLSLLKEGPAAGSGVDENAIYRQAARLVQTLSDYKIEGKITEVHPGPVVTMYEFVPVSGTRISKIAALDDDLAMSLAAQRVRIVAPIPGKGAIGIEVPNETRETVYFKEIVAHDAFRKGKAKLGLAMGKNISGGPVVMDLAKMPHLLVAGATGAGKSVSINSMICSLLMAHTPEEVRLIMVDPKFLELSGYNEIPHLMLPVVTDPKKANVALRWAVNEMERRYQLLADMRVRDITSYNRKVAKLRGAALAEEEEEGSTPGAEATIDEALPTEVRLLRCKGKGDGSAEPVDEVVQAAGEAGDGAAGDEDGAAELGGGDSALAQDTVEGPVRPPALARAARRARKQGEDPLPKRLPYIVVVIDEFADLMMVASKEVETSVARLAQKARAAGIHVILATQRPSVDVITGLIKANFPSRVSFQVASSHDSKTILGTNGAENLLGAGDMLVLDRGASMKRIHGAFISDEEIQGIVDWLREQGRPVYDMDILKPPEDEAEAGEAEEATDAMYDSAVALVAESRQASISWIQRQLRVGYNRAERMVERMEREGVVGPADGVRPREVLIRFHE